LALYQYSPNIESQVAHSLYLIHAQLCQHKGLHMYVCMFVRSPGKSRRYTYGQRALKLIKPKNLCQRTKSLFSHSQMYVQCY